MSGSSRRYLFLSGCKRSATEYTNHLFDGHPQLKNIFREFYGFELAGASPNPIDTLIGWFGTAPVLEVYENVRARELLPTYAESNILPGLWEADDRGDETDEARYFKLPFDVDAFLAAFEARRGSVSDFKTLLHHWLDALDCVSPWSTMPDDARWLLKCADFGRTLRAAAAIDLIDHAIFNVRHPIGIVNSIKRLRQSERHRDFHVFELLAICSSLESVPTIINDLGSRVTLVRYEDLIENPNKTMKIMCDRLNVDWHDTVTRPSLAGVPWSTNTSFAAKGEQRSTVLTPVEVEMIQQHTAGYCAAFDYQ